MIGQHTAEAMSVPPGAQSCTPIITLNVPPLPTFSRHTDDDFDLFQTSLDNYFALTNLDEAQKVSYVNLLLTGPAGKLVTQAPVSERDTYAKLMHLLRKNFSSAATQELHLSSLVTRRQRPGEPLFSFYTEMLKHLDSCNIRDKHMRRVFFVNGLLPELREKIIISAVPDIQAAYNLACILDNGNINTTRGVNTVQANTVPTASHPTTSRATAPVTSTQYNQRDQHSYQDRGGPPIICYGCGAAGHISRHCPRKFGGGPRNPPPYNQRMPHSGQYPQRPVQYGQYGPRGQANERQYQAFPGIHHVRTPNQGANPFCRSCNAAHPYFQDMLQCLAHCGVEEPGLKRSLFINGLLPELRERVIASVSNIYEAFILASRLHNQGRADTKAANTPRANPANVNAFQTNSNQPDTTLADIVNGYPGHDEPTRDWQGRPRPRPRVRVCYKCRRRGHEAANCAAH